MGCGSSNATVSVAESKQVSRNSQAPPKQTVMKADKFLSREEARERRQKVLEEKQSRSQNNARAISAQALVDQERLSTSTRRSVRSFASSSTAATPLKVTEPSTQELSSTDPESIQTSAVVEGVHHAPEVIVEESKSIISSEDREGKAGSLPGNGRPESGRAGRGKEEIIKQAGSTSCDGMKADAKSMDTAEAERSELVGSNSQKDGDRLAKDGEDRTMKNGNLNENGDRSEQWDQQLSSERNESHCSDKDKSHHLEDPTTDNDENLPEVTEISTESEEQSRGQRLNPSNQEHQEDQNDKLSSQEMDGAPIIGLQMAVEGKPQQRDGIQGDASDGSDEGVADLDETDDEMESEVRGGTS